MRESRTLQKDIFDLTLASIDEYFEHKAVHFCLYTRMCFISCLWVKLLIKLLNLAIGSKERV